MEGVSAADITDADKTLIKASIADASDYITAADINVTSITDIAARRLGAMHKRALLTAGVNVEYETTVVLSSTPFSDPAVGLMARALTH